MAEWKFRSRRAQQKIKPKKTYFTSNKENNIRNIVCVFMFQQRLSSKHYRLRDSKLAECM